MADMCYAGRHLARWRTSICSQVSTMPYGGTTPRKLGYVLRGPCPTKVGLCPTNPNGGTPVERWRTAQVNTKPYGGTTLRKLGYVIPNLTGALPHESYVTSYQSSHGSTPVAILLARWRTAHFFFGATNPRRRPPETQNFAGGFRPQFLVRANLHPLF